mgnify:CR=1 FL=1
MANGSTPQERKRKARAPRQERGIQTKELIVQAAQRLFAANGFHKTSSKQIVREAGVSVGSFYGYYDDKKAVFIDVIAAHALQVMERIRASLAKPDLGDDPRSMIAAMVDMAIEAHSTDKELHREAITMRYTDADIARILNDYEDEVTTMLVPYLDVLGEQIKATDHEAASRLIFLAVEEIVHSLTLFGSKIDTGRLVQELKDMLYRYLFGTD